MGGLGKTSLAVRLCERLPEYTRLVWVGLLDEVGFLNVVGDRLSESAAGQILNEPGLILTQRVRNLLNGPLAEKDALFVFDDFEQNLDEDGSGGHRLKPEALTVLTAVLSAIRQEGSRSRFIVTSRYTFPLPGPAGLYEEGLESLRDADLAKKLEQLGHLTKADESLRKRAEDLAAGNPRLLERLDRALADTSLDHDALLTAVEAVTEAYREEIFLRKLLEQQTPEARRLLACLSVYNLPVEKEAVQAAYRADHPVEPHLTRVVAVSLAEAGKMPGSDTPRYFASPLVSPLLDGALTDEERYEATERAAKHLYATWWKGGTGVNEAEALETHRLALAVENCDIVAEIGDKTASWWLAISRYKEAVLLCELSLSTCEDYRLRLALARGQRIIGETTKSGENFEQALNACPDATDDKSLLHDRALILGNYAQLFHGQGYVDRAMDLWQQALNLFERLDDMTGKASALHEMARLLYDQGHVDRAMQLWQQSLELEERSENIQGKAATMQCMASVIANKGDVGRAMDLLQKALNLFEQCSDIKGRAQTLHEMARIIADRGDIDRAMQLWQQTLVIADSIGDAGSKAATLAYMAWGEKQRNDDERSLALYREAAQVVAKARLWGDLRKALSLLGEFNTLNSIAYMAQALWLATFVNAPLTDAIGYAGTVLINIGVESQYAPVIAATALYLVQTRDDNHPERGQLLQASMGMLAACAQTRNIQASMFETWIEHEGLQDPTQFLPMLHQALEKIVGDEWLFDRADVIRSLLGDKQ
jgi:tetratricopeptide (TPR) repeat protein